MKFQYFNTLDKFCLVFFIKYSRCTYYSEEPNAQVNPLSENENYSFFRNQGDQDVMVIDDEDPSCYLAPFDAYTEQHQEELFADRTAENNNSHINTPDSLQETPQKDQVVAEEKNLSIETKQSSGGRPFSPKESEHSNTYELDDTSKLDKFKSSLSLDDQRLDKVFDYERYYEYQDSTIFDFNWESELRAFRKSNYRGFGTMSKNKKNLIYSNPTFMSDDEDNCVTNDAKEDVALKILKQ